MFRASQKLRREFEARRGRGRTILGEIDPRELGKREAGERAFAQARRGTTRRIEEDSRFDEPAQPALRRSADEPGHGFDPRAFCGQRAIDRERAGLDRLTERVRGQQRGREHHERSGDRLAALVGELRGLACAKQGIRRQAEPEVGTHQIAEQLEGQIVATAARECRDASAQLRDPHERLAIRDHARSILGLPPAGVRSNPMDEATAAVERAEREPLFGHRMPQVRAAIDAAAPVLDRHPVPALRARLLLRLSTVLMAAQDYEGADQALEAVGRHVPDDTTLRFLTGVRACRVAIRRGPEPRRLAAETLINVATRLDAFETNTPPWDVVTTEVALAIAELALHDDEPDPSAFEPIAALADAVTDVDTAYVGHQLVAAFAIQTADPERAARSLRAAVLLAKPSPADEVESRIALASVLVALATPIALEEAARTIQIARDRALEHGLDELHRAALIAQAGVLSAAGKTAGAIDRVLELARAAVANSDVTQYVAAVGIMAELYAKTGDHVSAFRTIAESHRALAEATNSDPTALFRPLLARLRDRIGPDKLDKIAAEVAIANRLADQIVAQKTKHPE